MVTKKSILLFVVYSLSIATIIGMHTQPNLSSQQKAFYAAVKNNNLEAAIEEAQKLNSPVFTVAVDGTRTMRQVNALNYAIQVFAERRDTRLLSALLRDVGPAKLNEVIAYQDQDDNKTPQDVLDEQLEGVDALVFLGMYIKRTSAPYLNLEELLPVE